MANCKEPRIPYNRHYVYLHPDTTVEEAVQIFRDNFAAKRTVGFSADDAGIGVGCLPERTIEAFNIPSTEKQNYISFWNQYYPGANLVFPKLKSGDLVIDISYWQREIDLVAAKNDGVKHVIIKASEWTVPDPAFLSLVGKAVNAGLPYSIYHFYTNNSNPEDQADTFINLAVQAKMVFGIGPEQLFLDLEQKNDLNEQTIKNIKTFLDIVTETIGNPGIYTAKWWITGYALPAVNNDPKKLEFMNQHKLWLAAYQSNPPKAVAPWSKVYLWQKGQFTKVWNVSACDINYLM